MDKAEAEIRFAEQLKYECPDCKKPPGQLCDTLGVWVHLSRMKLAEQNMIKLPSGGIPWGEDLWRDCAEMRKLELWGIFPGGYHVQNCSLH